MTPIKNPPKANPRRNLGIVDAASTVATTVVVRDVAVQTVDVCVSVTVGLRIVTVAVVVISEVDVFVVVRVWVLIAEVCKSETVCVAV